MTYEEAVEKVNEHFRLAYKKTLDDLEISDVPGYWNDKEAKIHTNHPLNNCIGNQGVPFKLSYTYIDPCRDHRGRFASQSRTWKVIYDKEKGKIEI